jgi:hypothetical protein
MFALILYCVGICPVQADPKSALIYDTLVECRAESARLHLGVASPVRYEGDGYLMGMAEMATCIPVYRNPKR